MNPPPFSRTKVVIRRLAVCAALLAGLLSPEQARAELLGQEAPLDELIAALESDDFHLWTRSTSFLGQRGSAAKPAVPALIRALDSPHKRESVLQALKGIGPAAAEAVPVLVEGIARWTDPSARWIAAQTLVNIGPAARPALRAAAAGSNPIVAIWAHAALAKQLATDGSPGAPAEHLSFLAVQLRASRPGCSAEALRAIQMIGPVSAPLIPDLQAAQADGIINIKDLVESLHDIGPAGDIIESILPALESKDEFTRMRGAQTLAHIGSARDRAALPLLLSMLESPGPGPVDDYVQRAAIRAIGRIDAGDRRVRTMLLSAARTPSSRIKEEATQILFLQSPIDDELVACFIEYVRTHATEIEHVHIYGGFSSNIPSGFVGRLSPANRGSAYQFEALAQDFGSREAIQQIVQSALRRMGAVPASKTNP